MWKRIKSRDRPLRDMWLASLFTFVAVGLLLYVFQPYFRTDTPLPLYGFYLLLLLFVIVCVLTATWLIDRIIEYSKEESQFDDLRSFFESILTGVAAGFIVLLLDEIEISSTSNPFTIEFWFSGIIQIAYIFLIVSIFAAMAALVYLTLRNN